MRLSSRSTGPSRRRRRYNSSGWRERERGDESSTGRCRSFWRDEPSFQLFSLPRYSDLSSTQCFSFGLFVKIGRTRKILLTGTKPSSWINRATRVIIRFTDSTIFLTRNHLTVSFSRLPFDGTRFRIESREEFHSCRFYYFYFDTSRREWTRKRNKIPYYSKFPFLAASIPTLLVRRSIVHDDGRLFALRLFCDSYNKRSGTTIDVRSCEARSPREILLVLDRVTVRTKTCSLRQEPRRDVLRRDSPLKNDVSLCSSSSSRSLVKP